MKKLLTIAILILTLCFALVGCTDDAKTPPETGTPSVGTEQGNTDGDDTKQDGENTPDIEQNETPQIGSNTTDGEQGSGAEQKERIEKMYITIGGNKMEVTLENNSSADALVELLKSGDIIYTASDYGGFEKVGGLGHTLPTNHTQIKTEPGDVILYLTDQIVLFYGSNSWSYTRLGKIKYSSLSELKSFLGAGNGNIQVTLSLK